MRIKLKKTVKSKEKRPDKKRASDMPKFQKAEDKDTTKVRLVSMEDMIKSEIRQDDEKIGIY